ncbi:alginate O-acetyltransferase AlgX-related protein [Tropicibacter naphthalenivorans]|uniref:AlgX/AlgJ SGNH hydrolase-like domain-containing protein n=1 Tax=Tropicibacter naphthalenivorans TaxID=441103 RepID=A0A0P1GED9_9RHOB|nr:hypothetical protein [Tropicibacter naphthalenivorans]CUH80076.1 hypothetical protein TRN7648_02796 [Tropicibacter naphthalenivorans]SMC84358.1 alginate O-acetyltransferase complex protein AlgJ [Tropicibacter naphthalenivorans]
MTTHVYIKALLPVAFFGYAGAANVTLLSQAEAQLTGALGFWNGKLTQQIDTLYRDNLPHKDPAIGWIGAARYLMLDEGRPGVVVGQNGTLFTAEEFRPVADGVYARALDEVVLSANLLAGQGAELVVAPLPAKVDLLGALSPDAAAGAELEALYHRFVADLAAAGVATIDTRPALLALEQPFLATDTHWTPSGAKAVAQTIADSGALPLGETVFSIETEVPARFAGDLVNYVTSDALAPHIGLNPEEVAPYRAIAAVDTGAALDLFGGGAEDQIDLVGTSYSANPNWSFPEALKLALSRDVINYAQEGRGPFAPMQDYLDQRDPLSGAGQVIWEIPVRYLTEPRKTEGEV